MGFDIVVIFRLLLRLGLAFLGCWNEDTTFCYAFAIYILALCANTDGAIIVSDTLFDLMTSFINVKSVSQW